MVYSTLEKIAFTMKMAERFRELIQPVDPQENLTIPSRFVLRQRDEERRLIIGDKFNLSFLDSTNIQEENMMKSLEIVVSPNECLILRMTWANNARHNAEWGLRNLWGKKDRKELETTFTKHSLTSGERQRYIEGSALYFEYSDGKPVKLHGDNWTLEYKPL